MSDLNPTIPLPEGFQIGKSVSSHNGIVCSPALKEGTDERYIVKTISVPASQGQLDALLMTGAYPDAASAMEYFRTQAEAIEKEVQLLDQLSRLEGFLSYDSVAVRSADEERLSYQITLIGSFKRSLERYLRSTPITHLEAVNLGLDLCAALACCRRMGYLYVDLKPSNIYISEDKEYKIGDIGFVPLTSLPFTSMPEKYVSPYTAPELRDAMEVIGETADTYGVGMILYRIYNSGKLPAKSRDLSEPLPVPANADEEIAQIILKACSPIPEERWATPTEMGQALVSYMQRHVINDVPLTAPATLSPATGKLPSISQEVFKAAMPEAKPAAEALGADTQIFRGELPNPSTAEHPGMEAAEASNPEAISENPPAVPEESAPIVPAPVPEPEEIPVRLTEPEAPTVAQPEFSYIPPVVPEPMPEPEDPYGGLPTIPELEAEEETLDLTEIDALLGSETPEKPQKKAVFAPPPIVEEQKPKRHIFRNLLVTILVLALLGGLGYGGFWYYTNSYQQTIDNLLVEGAEDRLTVSVVSSLPDSALQVVCTDAYGSSTIQPLSGGKAVFENLNAGSLYNIHVEPVENIKLSGKTYEIFSTPSRTNIISMNAITGAEDGSVLLTLNVDGNDPEAWVVTCSAQRQEDVVQSFTGHTVTIRGLSVGEQYTLTLSTSDGTPLTGKTSIPVNVSRVLLAKNLTVTTDDSLALIIHWDQPENSVIPEWTVRCYGENYDKTMTVTGTEAVFDGIDTAISYTIEVTADGMTQSARTSITANPIHIRSYQMERSDDQLTLNWEFDGRAPQGGWLVTYRIDNSSTRNIVQSETASAAISIVLPGSHYTFNIQAADNTSIFGNEYAYDTPQAQQFKKFTVDSSKVELKVLPTPEEEGWRADSLSASDYTDQIPTGKKISLVLKANMNFFLENAKVDVRFIIRDSSGSVLLNQIGSETIDWNALWFDGDYHLGELDVPVVPTTAGDYTMDIYFDGMLFGNVSFSIT